MPPKSTKLIKPKLSNDDFDQQNPVDGSHFGWPRCQRHGSGRVCPVFCIYREPQGAVPPGFNPPWRG